MAHDGTGTGWDETSPSDSEAIEDGATEVRDLRKAARIRLEKEHVIPATASAGGEHKAGSGMAFHQTTTPTVRPDGTTSFTAADAGRLWVHSTNKNLSVLDNAGSFHNVVPAAGVLTKTMCADGFLAGILPMAVLREVATTGNVVTGGITSGAWRTRVLNEETSDAGTIVSLDTGTGIFTLSAGTYRIFAWAIGHQIGGNQIRLRNITDSSTPTGGNGSSELAPTGVEVHSKSCFSVRFEILGTKEFKIEHYCHTTNTTDGLGKAANVGLQEVYAEVVILKEL